MNEKEVNQGQQNTALVKFWNFVGKTADRIAYFAAPIIVIGYIYLAVIGKITIKFDLAIFIFAIFSIIILPFLSMLTVGPNNKNINKQISRTNWDKWIRLGKTNFVLLWGYHYFAISITYITVLFFLLKYKEGTSAFIFQIYYFLLLLGSFAYGLVYGSNAWNYKRNEKNTIRNKVIGFFKRTTA